MLARTGRSHRSRTSLWLCILSAAFIVYGTTIPFRFLPWRVLILSKWDRVTFNPLYPSTSGKRVSIPDAAQNVLLFLPIGIFGAAALESTKSSGRRVLAVAAAGGALSTTVEGLQLMDPGRVASFADVVFNTCGAALGAVASPAVLDGVARIIRSLKRRGALDAPTSFPLIVGVVLVCLAAWQPFDVTLDSNVGLRKLTALGRDVWQARGRTNAALEMFRFLVLTLLAASWLRDLRVRRATTLAVAACCALAGLLEATQMLIASRMPGLVDLSINMAAVMAGGLLFQPLGRALSLRGWVVLLVAVTFLGDLVPSLAPIRRPPAHLPFWQWSLGFGRYYWAIVIGRLSELLLMYFPFGFALSWVVKRTRRVYIWSMAVAVVCELSLVGVERWAGVAYPNIANVVVAALGSLGGAWIGSAGQRWFLNQVHALVRPAERAADDPGVPSPAGYRAGRLPIAR